MERICYQLPRDARRGLVRRLLDEHRSDLPASRLAAFRFNGDSDYANLARTVEAEVFLTDLGDGWTVLAQDFDGFEVHSHFFLIVDQQRLLAVGTFRVVDGGKGDFPTFVHLRRNTTSFDPDLVYATYRTEPKHVWDMGAAAVLPEYRASAAGSVAAGLLYRCVYAGARASDIDLGIALAWPDMLRKVKQLGFPADPLIGQQPIHYPDGTVYHPCVTVVREQADHMRSHGRQLLRLADNDADQAYARHKTQQIEAIITGVGLDDHLAFRHGPIPVVTSQPWPPLLGAA